MTDKGRMMFCSCNLEALSASDATEGFSSVIEGLAVEVCSDAASVREKAAGGALEALWVESCEDIEPINLAAACKSDSPATEVFLVAADRTGSVVSRANAAHLDGIVRPSDLSDSLREAALRLAGNGECGHREEEAPALTEAPSDRGDKARSGFLLTVVSGSGGAGKSTVAVLAALASARRGLKTALLDADLQFGDLGELAGFCPAVSIEEVIAKPAALEEVGEAPLALFKAPRALERSEAISESLGTVVERVCQAFDVVVVNTGGSWGEQHLQLLERSAATLFLVDQRASSVRACRHALDLCLRCGIATSSFLLAVNRCTRHAPFTSIDVSSALDGAHVDLAWLRIWRTRRILCTRASRGCSASCFLLRIKRRKAACRSPSGASALRRGQRARAPSAPSAKGGCLDVTASWPPKVAREVLHVSSRTCACCGKRPRANR